MKSACVIVIGHVDHGKTTLVRALTGMETDTLAQEKQRGLSINLGFAHCRTASGTIDLIDAPGHEDFIRAMVAGATGAHAAMLVISVLDGIAPQTIEHLRIAELLAVPVRLVALTKADLLPPEELENRSRDIRKRLSELGVSDVPLIPVSPVLETGYKSLTQELDAFLGDGCPGSPPCAAFLPIDRVFTVAGRGTVVTGTLLGADLDMLNDVELHPQNQAATLRGLQARGQDRKRVSRGARVAVNLRGVSQQEVARGDVLCASKEFGASDCMDVELTLLDDASRALKHMSKLRVLFGTAHVVATLRLMGGGQLAPSHKGFAQLRFKTPVTAFAGQRMVLRSLSPAETIGGAVVLDPVAGAVKSGDAKRLAVMRAAVNGSASQIANALCEEGRGCALMVKVARLARQPKADVLTALASDFVALGEGMIAQASAIEWLKTDILERLATCHATRPARRFAPRAQLVPLALSPRLVGFVLDRLQNHGLIVVGDDQIALARHDPWGAMDDTQLQRIEEIETAFKDGRAMPPDPKAHIHEETDADLFDLLIADKKLVPLFNVALKQRLVFHQNALSQAAEALRVAFPPPISFSTGQARQTLNTSRKFIVPLLEWFDTREITLRRGDSRQMAQT